MVITEINLEELVRQHEIAPLANVDKFSITLHLDKTVRRYVIPSEKVVTYGITDVGNRIETIDIESEYILKPGDAILACSSEVIKMPVGYMGFIQTKGSLARLFVSVHCCDGQIEPGFEGKITFEICNIGPLSVKLVPQFAVSQLYIFKTSSDRMKYDGRYNNSSEPTFSKVI